MSDPIGVDLTHAGVPFREQTIELTRLVLVLLRKLGGEATVTPDEMIEVDDGDIVLTMERADDEGTGVYKIVPRYVEHERVKPGGWLHVMSGTAILVKGVTRDAFVRYHVQVGEPGEHLHELPVDEFLLGHVPADDVPFIGGEA